MLKLLRRLFSFDDVRGYYGIVLKTEYFRELTPHR